MKSQKEIIKSKAYWFEKSQNQLFRELHNYMKEHNKTQTDIAKEMNFTKGYISQILNGNFNPSLKKLIELAIFLGKVPQLSFLSQDEYLKKINKNSQNDQKHKITYKLKSFHKSYAKVSDAKKKNEGIYK